MTDSLRSEDYAKIALARLVRVFGAAEGEQVLARTLRLMNMERLASADDLYRFASTLSRSSDPIAAAVGGLLGVTALLNGASGQ